MKNFWSLTAGAALTVFAVAGAVAGEVGTEPRISAPITGVAIFKNGTAAVTRAIAEPPETAFILNQRIAPVRGTLWFTPGLRFDVALVKRMLDQPNFTPFNNLSETYAGQRVTLEIRTGMGLPRRLAGIVQKPVKPNNGLSDNAAESQFSHQPFLVLEQEDTTGRLISVRQELIESIQSDAIRNVVKKETPVLLFTPREKLGSNFRISYVTRGLDWLPAYRLVLSGDKQMHLTMSAEVVNQLENLKQVPVSLVAGYPNIYCANELSALSTVEVGLPPPVAAYRTDFLLGKENTSDMASPAASSAADSGTTADLHQIDAGKISLDKGGALYLDLGGGKGEFERLVDWVIPDRFSASGYLNRNNRNSDGTLWDAVRFSNPLKTPLVPAPVEIVDGDQVLAVSKGDWVNAGERTTLHITKALTVNGKVNEYEAKPLRPAENDAMEAEGAEGVSSELPLGTPPLAARSAVPARVSQVWINGVRYRNPDVVGVLTLKNFRETPALVAIKLNYSGNLISADRNFVNRSVGRGIATVNRQNVLEWELTLASGEELKLNYRYSVLIRD